METQEIWKDISGYENKYQISNMGRVKSLYFSNQTGNFYREKILKVSSIPYPAVVLSIDGKLKTFRIHRLVANTFIPNTDNKSEVNHKNGIKTDNRVENLEWCNRRENIIHSIYTLGHELKIGIKKGVIMRDDTGKVVSVFNSFIEAGRYLGVTGEAIGYSVKNKSKCRGYFFEIESGEKIDVSNLSKYL